MSTELVFGLAGAVSASVLVVLGILAARLISPGAPLAFHTDDLGASLRYRPMLRLLDEEDLRFLSRQPGFSPKMAAALRSQRLAMFRRYLRQMKADFHRLHHTLRLLTLAADQDRPEVSRALLEQRLLFSWRMCQVECRLAFYWLGVKPVDVGGLVQTIEQLQGHVSQLSGPVLARVGASA